MNEKLEKTELKNFVRDPYTNALLNTDVEGYNAYKERRNSNMLYRQLEAEVSDL
jgi:hypothetical protein